MALCIHIHTYIHTYIHIYIYLSLTILPCHPQCFTGHQHPAARRVNTWTDFSSSDPLYALKGEVASAALVDDAGAVDEVKMAQYLEA